MMVNFIARFLIALTQLYAISVFTRIHDSTSMSVMILLFGYIIWFNLFELGLSQTIQNRLNIYKLKIKNISKIILLHYIFVVVIAGLLLNVNLFSFLLLNNTEILFTDENKNNFDIGCSFLILTSNNLLIHRFLILYKKSKLLNLLLICQAIITSGLLFFYQKYFNAHQLSSLLIYFLPQLFINFPILTILFVRAFNSKNVRNIPTNLIYILKYTSSFLLITFLSSFLLGLDYFMISYFSDSEEMLSYHITIRFFYFSFMMYFAYITFVAKKINTSTNINDAFEIKKIKKNTAFIGMSSVILIYVFVLILNQIGLLELITNGVNIDNQILFGAFVYFSVRVFADTRIVIAQNLSYRISLIKLYTTQIIISLICMPFLCYFFGGLGVLMSLSLSYISGFFVKLEGK
ncbi:hypothetical protein N8310_04630 [Pseudomonadota bacterium]|nr:hypothetical protein [Pseudomonadota bacterium]